MHQLLSTPIPASSTQQPNQKMCHQPLQAGEETNKNYAPSSEGEGNGRKLLQASVLHSPQARGCPWDESHPASPHKVGAGRDPTALVCLIVQPAQERHWHGAPGPQAATGVSLSYKIGPDNAGSYPNPPLQADIAPTAVAVLGAPVAESLLGSGGTGRRLQQGGQSLAAQLLAPIAESLTTQPGTGRRLQQASENSVAAQLLAPLTESLNVQQPGTGRRLQQGAGDVGGGLGVERTIPATESLGAEQLGTTGRRLQQGGESVAAQLLAPLTESLTTQPGTGRRLQQASENVVTAVGPASSPLGENLAESASIGRRLQQVGWKWNQA